MYATYLGPGFPSELLEPVNIFWLFPLITSTGCKDSGSCSNPNKNWKDSRKHTGTLMPLNCTAEEYIQGEYCD